MEALAQTGSVTEEASLYCVSIAANVTQDVREEGIALGVEGLREVVLPLELQLLHSLMQERRRLVW